MMFIQLGKRLHALTRVIAFYFGMSALILCFLPKVTNVGWATTRAVPAKSHKPRILTSALKNYMGKVANTVLVKKTKIPKVSGPGYTLVEHRHRLSKSISYSFHANLKKMSSLTPISDAIDVMHVGGIMMIVLDGDQIDGRVTALVTKREESSSYKNKSSDIVIDIKDSAPHSLAGLYVAAGLDFFKSGSRLGRNYQIIQFTDNGSIYRITKNKKRQKAETSLDLLKKNISLYNSLLEDNSLSELLTSEIIQEAKEQSNFRQARHLERAKQEITEAGQKFIVLEQKPSNDNSEFNQLDYNDTFDLLVKIMTYRDRI